MKLLNYIIAKILFISLVVQGIAVEEIAGPPPSIVSNEQKPLPSESIKISNAMINKKILYGTLAIFPGAGLSVRERCGSNGNAVDYKIGLIPFTFDTASWIPVLSVDYNFLYYSRENEISPYFSYGIGAAYFIPYVPLRAGIEFKHGFIDVGGKLILGFLPSPEIRGGIVLNF